MGTQHINLSSDRTGVIGKNKHGSLMKIVLYKNANDMLVKFDKGKPIHTRWAEFMIGEVKNPYDKTIFGVGFLGEGIYKAKENSEDTPQYMTWVGMLQRCYDEKIHKKHPTYKECSVCEEWHNFQTFSKWYDENYYEIDGERMNLDKDILIKGNKFYSHDTCVFVPQRINLLFVKNDAIRSKLPIGVHFEKQTNRYKAQCKVGKGKMKNLGRYNSPEEAFYIYKTFKEKFIKEVANEYESKIPEILYKAMLKYEVGIND